MSSRTPANPCFSDDCRVFSGIKTSEAGRRICLTETPRPCLDWTPFALPGSSAVEQVTVNHLVVGSIPTQAARKDSFLTPAHRGRSVNLLLDHPRGCGRMHSLWANRAIKSSSVAVAAPTSNARRLASRLPASPRARRRPRSEASGEPGLCVGRARCAAPHGLRHPRGVLG